MTIHVAAICKLLETKAAAKRNGPTSEKIGAPGEIRTPYPLVRSQVLYPDELRARCERLSIIQAFARFCLACLLLVIKRIGRRSLPTRFRVW